MNFRANKSQRISQRETKTPPTSLTIIEESTREEERIEEKVLKKQIENEQIENVELKEKLQQKGQQVATIGYL